MNNVEDTKRLRTKLRLDLDQVAKDIADLEKEMKKNKSKENIESHAKLVEYEKKLKKQYQELAGISIEQASNLTREADTSSKQKSRFAAFLGLITCALFAWGSYNMVLHGVEGFMPQDVINALTNGSTVPNLVYIINSLTYGTSILFVVGPLGAVAAISFILWLTEKERNKFLGLLDFLSFAAVSGFFVYVFYYPKPQSDRIVSDLETNFMILGAIIAASGLFMLFSSLGYKSVFSKLICMIAGIAMIGAGALILTTTFAVFFENWALIMTLLMASGSLRATNYFFRLFF